MTQENIEKRKVGTHMEYVKIISDSTCDLSGELIDRYDISILPLHVLLGEKEYKDGVDITPEDIYRWSDENNTTPKTSAPSMEEAMELMRPFVEAGREVVCFSISDSMSSSGNAMRLAARELEAEHLVTVIDSRNPVSYTHLIMSRRKKIVIWLQFHVRNIRLMGKLIRQLELCIIIQN